MVVTAQPGGIAPRLGHTTIHLSAQTMADKEVIDQSPTIEKILPMGSVYEGAMFVLFEIAVLLLRKRLNETVDTMRTRHTNME